MAQQTLSRAIRSSTSQVLSTIRRRRLRLGSLPTQPRTAVTATLGGAGLAGILLVLTPLGVGLPGGEIAVLRSDAPEIARFHLAVSQLTLAAALGALAMAASGYGRRSRLLLAGLAVIGLLVAPSVLGSEGLAFASVLAGLASLACAVALLAVAVLGRPRGAILPAALAAAPPVWGLLAVMTAGTARAESELATSILTATTLVEAPLVAIAVWGVIEYSRGIVAGAARISSLDARFGWLAVVGLVAKISLLVLGGLGVLASFSGIDAQLISAPLRESPLTIAWACLLVTLAAVWMLHGAKDRQADSQNLARDPGRSAPQPDGVTRAAWLLLTPLLAGYLLPLAAFAAILLPNRFGLLTSPADILEWSTVVDTIQDYTLALTPAVVALIALGAGVVFAFHVPRRRAAGLFLFSFAAWTLIPAAFHALGSLAGTGLSDVNGGPLGQIHVVTLDLLVTVVVALLLVSWYAGMQRLVRPLTLLAVLVVTTILAFAGRLFGSEVGVLLFWLGFVFPLVAQFALDAAPLNRPGTDRPPRVLRATGMSALALSMALPLVALGFARPDGTGLPDFARSLFLVPFAAALLPAVLFAGVARADSPPPDPLEAVSHPPPPPGTRAPSRQFGMAALITVAMTVTGAGLVALQEAPPPPPDPAVQEGNGFSIRVPPEYEMTYTAAGYDLWLSSDGARAIVVYAYGLAETDGADPLETALDLARQQLSTGGNELVAPPPRSDLPAGPAYVGRASGPVASGGEFTFMVMAEGRRGWTFMLINFDPLLEQRTLESIRLAEPRS